MRYSWEVSPEKAGGLYIKKVKDPLKDQCGLKDMCLEIQWDV